jgi:acylphosphatase
MFGGILSQTEQKVRLHAFAEGIVQGVGFRFFVIHHAEELQLTGWVRNLWDGRVEVVAEGMKKPLETLLNLLEDGPTGANVSRVVSTWQKASGEFNDFSVTASFYKVSD